MKDPEKSRSAIKSRAERTKAIIAAHGTTPLTLAAAEMYIETLTKDQDKLVEVHDELLVLCADDNAVKVQEKATANVEQILNETCVAVRNIRMALAAAAAPTSNQSTSSQSINQQQQVSTIRLPRLELPEFDGKYEDWPSYHDLFVATVENNTTLSGAQKLQYLKSTLKGEALSLIKSMQVSDRNYNEAMKILRDRYDNKREIATSLLKKFFSQPILTRESAADLKKLIDTSNECIRALQVLGRPVDQWDDIVVFLIVQRLDPESRKHWALTLKGTDMPTLKELQEFLEQYIRGLMAGGATTATHGSNKFQQKQHHRGADKRSTQANIGTTTKCVICKGDHWITKCTKFTSATSAGKYDLARRNHLCYNCLRPGHGTLECPNELSCRKCSRRHNTLLHFDNKQTDNQTKEKKDSKDNKPPEDKNKDSNSSEIASLVAGGNETINTLLATALVNVKDSHGIDRTCRVLLDGGSQASFMSEACAKSLGLKRLQSKIHVAGFGAASAGTTRGKVEVKLSSLIDHESIKVTLHVFPKVTGNQPNFNCKSLNWNHLKGLKLADPNFSKSSPIDILLGADYKALIMKGSVRHGDANTPSAENTIFGWVLSGSVSDSNKRTVHVHHTSLEVATILERFWELDKTPEFKHLTPEEEKCQQHFNETHSRDADGRYIVCLPKKDNIVDLGYSKKTAEQRFLQLEKRLETKPETKKKYCEFVKEFIDLNHLEEVPQEGLNDELGKPFYLPHHCVLKDSSSTTKLRVVFNGSSKTSTGLSLNDCLMVGPTVQDDLFNILLRFRMHPIALKADIAKFYRQFRLADEDKDFHRILWRFSAEEVVKVYRMTRVTYGTGAAAFLATMSLLQLAKDGKCKFPTASDVLSKDFYVDDLLSGAATTEQAISLQTELSSLIESGGMELLKWTSNDPEVLGAIPENLRETELPLSFDRDDTIKALGIYWQPASDNFYFKVCQPLKQENLTKRKVLSELAKVFDPLGFLSPATIRAKMIFQSIWKRKLDWDDKLPLEIQQQWFSYIQDLKLIGEINISRYISSSDAISQEIHGFCDASEKAYCAVLYLRSESADDSYKVHLITSKCRVAPIKLETLPRLELLGAVMLADLIKVTSEAINFSGNIVAWTDSTTVLNWLGDFPSRWKTFVAHRVAKIQEILPVENWRHIPGDMNPADCGSRGISAAELQNHKLWWDPEFLHSSTLPSSTSNPDLNLVWAEVKRKPVTVTQVSVEPSSLINRYSSLRKLKRITAICLRFIRNCKTAKKERISGEITVEELDEAFKLWLRFSQKEDFADELRKFKKSGRVNSKSRIRNLNPILDDGLLKVGGRLHRSQYLPEGSKHPIILSKSSRIVTMIIQDYHLKLLHGGSQLLQAALQQKFWIIRIKDVIRKVTRQCVLCRRIKAKTAEQLMGNLPAARVNPSRAFSHCGIDYAGPFTVKVVKGRGHKSFKCYICLFVCLSTKAIHLEAVTELTTDAFLATLKRFTSRRGLSSDLYSDCGTNFVGADKELQKLVSSADHNSKVHNKLSDQGIRWHFNPPGAPHQGGLWEAGVKSVKFHLRRVMGTATLNYEDFQTLLCQIEACLNSRPLSPLSTDPDQLEALTPGHFLVGAPLTAIPESDFTSIPINRLSHWQHTQQLLQHFWKRWSTEYLLTLQQRSKWNKQHENLKVGDLVIIKDELQPPLKWKRGKIIAVHPGPDALVRVVTLKTVHGEVKRPIVKLVPILQQVTVSE